jgi:hypothetical protein
MPPSYMKTIRQLIYWEYAKLMADAAGLPKNFGFIVNRYKALDSGKIKMSSILREDQQQLKNKKICIYCGSKTHLSYDHIIPKSKGGPDNIHNQVLSCKKCNSSKGNKDIFEWFQESEKIPRLVKGKYLKLVYEFHNNLGTLDRSDINKDGKLDVMDLNIFNILFLGFEK